MVGLVIRPVQFIGFITEFRYRNLIFPISIEGGPWCKRITTVYWGYSDTTVGQCWKIGKSYIFPIHIQCINVCRALDPLGPKRQELPSVPPSAPYEAFNRIKGHPPDQNAILTHLKAIFSRMKPISCHLRHVGTHFAHKKPYLFSKKKRQKSKAIPLLVFRAFDLNISDLAQIRVIGPTGTQTAGTAFSSALGPIRGL